MLSNEVWPVAGDDGSDRKRQTRTGEGMGREEGGWGFMEEE